MPIRLLSYFFIFGIWLPVALADDLGTGIALRGGAIAWERQVTVGTRQVRVSGVSFNARQAAFRVIDNLPIARVPLADALQSAGAVAGTNGNYFHEDFTPLGLVVSDGKVVHRFETAKLLSGVLVVRNGRIEMVRSGLFKPGDGVKEALQTGPWLVEKGQPVAGLNSVRVARRTVITTDGAGNWALLAIDPVTLAETASLLAGLKIPENPIREALNLDGGSSTTLVALAGTQAVIDIPSFGVVRNYLAIVPRRP